MDQGQARKRAREIYEQSDGKTIAVATTARWSDSGNLIIGGWPSKDQFWIVTESGTEKVLDGLPIPTNPSDASMFVLEWLWNKHCDEPIKAQSSDTACECGYCEEYERRSIRH